tara:strand:- start:20341 stop:20817 length:477 start_codon:yes stop_codon:yes gene_type:complete
MIRYILILIFIGLAWGQALYFKNDEETIRINPGEKLQLNENKYTLLKTNYLKQYVLVEKYNSLIQDTLRFDTIVSFKYYEKSLSSVATNIIKCAKYGALIGAISGLPEGINYGIHWVAAGSIIFGGFGAFSGALYAMLIPTESEEILLVDKKWYIDNG